MGENPERERSMWKKEWVARSERADGFVGLWKIWYSVWIFLWDGFVHKGAIVVVLGIKNKN